MLSKQHRLKKEKDFKRAFKQGRGAGGNSLVLKTTKNNLSWFRAGFVVSKKISNKAVVRNKVKRRLREAVRSFQKEIKSGRDLVFIAQPGIEEQSFDEIKKAVKQLLEKSKLKQ